MGGMGGGQGGVGAGQVRRVGAVNNCFVRSGLSDGGSVVRSRGRFRTPRVRVLCIIASLTRTVAPLHVHA